MVFSSLTFLFAYLPAVLLVYYAVRGGSAIWCCFSSACFSTAGENRYMYC